MIYTKMSKIFWNRVNKTVKQYSSVGMQAQVGEDVITQLENIKKEQTETKKKTEEKMHRMSE